MQMGMKKCWDLRHEKWNMLDDMSPDQPHEQVVDLLTPVTTFVVQLKQKGKRNVILPTGGGSMVANLVDAPVGNGEITEVAKIDGEKKKKHNDNGDGDEWHKRKLDGVDVMETAVVSRKKKVEEVEDKVDNEITNKKKGDEAVLVNGESTKEDKSEKKKKKKDKRSKKWRCPC